MSLIEMRNVSKVYEMGEEKIHALRDVALSIEPNEYVAIMGPSGSGKSTLMNIVGCLDRPSSGSYVLRGKEVADLPED
ncbi:MAG TPA: ATP-binding cassette domain-containing protein, partial [bacterium]|nr:ATP-binding cassette domain-containing protein [bacterium]